MLHGGAPIEFFHGPVTTSVRCSTEVRTWLESLLTVAEPTNRFAYTTFFNGYHSTLLTGHLHWVEQNLIQQGLPYVVHNRPQISVHGAPDPKILSTPHHPGFTLKPYQVTTTRKMVLGMRGSVQLATGGGKTASYIAALKWLEQIEGDAPSLTIVTVTNLAKQMARRMKNAGLKSAIYGAKTKWREADHVVAVVNGLHRAIQRNDLDVLTMLGTRKVLCLDEAHHGQADMCFNVACRTPAPFRWMLSATLYANRANPYMHVGDMRILGIAGPTLAVIPARYLWEHGHVPKPSIQFVPMIWPDYNKHYGFRVAGRWQDTAVWRGTGVNAAQQGVEWDLIVNNEFRNEMIRRLVYWTLAQEPEAKFVILVQRLDHGRIIQRMLARVGVISACCFGGHKVVTVNRHCEQREWRDRKDTVLDDFDLGRLRVIIGSGKFDEGQSFPLFTDLILAQAGKGGEANRRVYQRVGRSFHSGLRVRVRDFYDRTHRMVQRQAETRLMALHSEGYPVEVELPEECTWEIPGIQMANPE